MQAEQNQESQMSRDSTVSDVLLQYTRRACDVRTDDKTPVITEHCNATVALKLSVLTHVWANSKEHTYSKASG